MRGSSRRAARQIFRGPIGSPATAFYALNLSPPELVIWNLNGHAEKSLKLLHGTKNVRYRYLEASQTLLIAMNFTNSGRVQLDRYDAHSLKLISSSDMSFSESMWTNFQKSESVLFSFRGEKVAVQNHVDEIRVYETLSGKLVKHLELPNLHGIQGMAISPDGNSLAYATRDRPLHRDSRACWKTAPSPSIRRSQHGPLVALTFLQMAHELPLPQLVTARSFSGIPPIGNRSRISPQLLGLFPQTQNSYGMGVTL